MDKYANRFLAVAFEPLAVPNANEGSYQNPIVIE
jgi:hypothetical protein